MNKRIRLFVIIFSFAIISTCFAAQPKNINMESYFPAPYGWYQNLNVNNILDATNPTSSAVAKVDIIRYTNHPYPITSDGSCTPQEEFNTVLAGANLHICWKYIENIPGASGQPPTQVISYHWTPAPFSNWSYDSLKNTVFTLPLILGARLPSVGVGTGADVRGDFEIRGTSTDGVLPATSAITTLMLSNQNNNRIWGLVNTALPDDPSTPEVESNGSFTIWTAFWPYGGTYVDGTELFRITADGRFGFHSSTPRALYSFDKLIPGGNNDKVLFAGLDLDFEFADPDGLPFAGGSDVWRISNLSPKDTLDPSRPLNDALNFIGMNGGTPSYALTLWQDKNQNNLTRVGIGMPFPQADLHVAGFGTRTFYLHNGFTAQDVARISFRNGGSSSNISGTERSYIQVRSDGKIGINTVNANEPLSVQGNITLGNLTNDYAVSAPFFNVPANLSSTGRVGARIVSGQINVSNAGVVTSVVGNDIIVVRVSAGVYRIRFVNSFANTQIFSNVTLVMPASGIIPAGLPVTPLVQINSPTQITVTLVNSSGVPADYSFYFSSIGSRR